MEEWKPWPKQELALKSVAFEILYGGARGPGKTDAGIVWMLKGLTFDRYRGLVIRKNAKDLTDWVDRARFMYSGQGVEVSGNPAVFKFPNGAKIYTGHLKDKNAYEQFQGHEYQRILIEELTQIPDEERYEKLISSCRSTVDGLDARIFCTTNPGGIGHKWVKKRFVDVCDPYKKYTDPETGLTRLFIPGTVDDNPSLKEKDPRYIQFLKGLKGDLKRAWLYGDWDILAGAYFTNFRRNTHVYNPSKVKILKSWPKFRSIDWGYTSPMAVYWHAIGPDSHVYTYRELYVTKMLDVDCAKLVNEMTGDEHIEYTVADPQSFPVEIPHYKFGKLVSTKRADVWAEYGVPVVMGDSSRIFGWNRMREYLEVRSYMRSESSWWHISSDCKNLIEEIIGAVHDDKKPEDMKDENDHALESCRLFLMSTNKRFDDIPERSLTHLEAAELQAEREEMMESEIW